MKSTFLKLWAWFTGTSGKLFNFLLPILTSEAGRLLEKSVTLAIPIVLQYAQSNFSNDEKNKFAVTQLRMDLQAEGILAGASIVKTAIELALQNLKATGEIK